LSEAASEYRSCHRKGKEWANQSVTNRLYEMGYVDKQFSKVDTKILLEVRGKKHPANVCALPFYKKNYVKGVN